MSTALAGRGFCILRSLRLLRHQKCFGKTASTILYRQKCSLILSHKQHGLGALKWARMLQSRNILLEGKADEASIDDKASENFDEVNFDSDEASSADKALENFDADEAFSDDKTSENFDEANFDADEASSDDKASEKEATLHAALTQISDDLGKESVKWLGRFFVRRNVSVISTGSLNLDLALGIGGLPKGRMIEIYGPEGSGKTTLALHVIAEAQRNGGQCVFIDAEHALDQSLAEAVGVKSQNLLFSQPNSGEQALNLIDKFIRSGCVDVIVIDSVAALVPQMELDGKMGDDHMKSQSIMMTQALRQLASPLSLSQTVLIFLNQVRIKFTPFGGTETTSGGNALKFYASVRLNIRRTGLLRKGDKVTMLIAREIAAVNRLGVEIVGSQVTVTVVKNKLAPPLKTAEFELEFGRGISSEGEVLDLGCNHGFVTKTGSLYIVNGQYFNGKENAKEYLRENPQVCQELISKLKEELFWDVGREYDIKEKMMNMSGSENRKPPNIVLDENRDDEIDLEGAADA